MNTTNPKNSLYLFSCLPLVLLLAFIVGGLNASDGEALLRHLAHAYGGSPAPANITVAHNSQQDIQKVR